MKFSIIVPTLNEKENIAKVLNDIQKQNPDEILVVDGHSTDGTQDIVKQLGYRLINQEGRGLGNAIKTGIHNSSGEIIVIYDADGSHDSNDIPKLVHKINEGYDLVVASRYISGPRLKGLFNRQSSSYDDTFIREIGNRMFTWMVRTIYGVKVHDILMGFKAFKRSIFQKIELAETGQQFDAEIIIKAQKAGFKIGEIPSIEYKRVYGKSKLSVPYHGFKILLVIIKEMFCR